jgi:hypothetical protein
VLFGEGNSALVSLLFFFPAASARLFLGAVRDERVLH